MEKISNRSLPLGIEVSARYATSSLTLAPGDRIVLYTDGFVDAVNDEDNRYGDNRLEDLVAIFRDLPSQEFISRLVEGIDSFAGTTPQFDDMTALIATVVTRKPDQVVQS